MKKIILPLLLCAALCGCGGAAAGNAVQDQYRTVRTARLEAEVTSHTDTDSRTFTLLCSYDAAGDAVTTVTQPHELAGLTAVASGEDMTLACEGLHVNEAYATSVVLLILVLLLNAAMRVVAQKMEVSKK